MLGCVDRHEAGLEDIVSKHTQSASDGFPILGILGVVFVTLKLVGVVSWSWWWVTAPFWAPVAIALFIVAVALAITGIRVGLKK